MLVFLLCKCWCFFLTRTHCEWRVVHDFSSSSWGSPFCACCYVHELYSSYWKNPFGACCVVHESSKPFLIKPFFFCTLRGAWVNKPSLVKPFSCILRGAWVIKPSLIKPFSCLLHGTWILPHRTSQRIFAHKPSWCMLLRCGLSFYVCAVWGVRAESTKRFMYFNTFFVTSISCVGYLALATGNGILVLRKWDTSIILGVAGTMRIERENVLVTWNSCIDHTACEASRWSCAFLAN